MGEDLNFCYYFSCNKYYKKTAPFLLLTYFEPEKKELDIGIWAPLIKKCKETKLEIMRPNKGVRAASSQRPKKLLGMRALWGEGNTKKRERWCVTQRGCCSEIRHLVTHFAAHKKTRRRALSSFQPESQLLTFNCASRSNARGFLWSLTAQTKNLNVD